MEFWSKFGVQVRTSTDNGPELILECEGGLKSEDVGKTQVGMLENQRIPGLLECRRDWTDSCLSLRYRVEGLRPLSSALKMKPLTPALWEGLLTALSLAVGEASQYLIKDSEVVLHPDWIWVGQDIRNVRLMAVPLRCFASPDSSYRQWNKLYDCMVENNLPEVWREALRPNQWESKTFRHLLWIDKFQSKPSGDIAKGALQDEDKKTVPAENAPCEPQFYHPPASSVIGSPIISKADDGETMRFSARSLSKDDLIRVALAAAGWIAFALYPEFLTLMAGVLGSIPLGYTLWQRYRRGEEKEAAQEAVVPAFPVPQATITGSMAERTVLLWPSPDETVALTTLLTAASKVPKARLEVEREHTDHIEWIDLTEMPFTIGRGPEQVRYRIEHAAVSRHHLDIRYKENQFFAVDLGSLNGSLRNDEPMKPNEAYPLQHGDTIRLPGTILRIHIDGSQL